MDKNYVNYDEAICLKMLGYDQITTNYYGKKKKITTSDKPQSKVPDLFKTFCLAPLYQEVFRWFREKHNLHATIIFSEKPDRFDYYIQNMITSKKSKGARLAMNKKEKIGDMSYEEAQSACLKQLIIS